MKRDPCSISRTLTCFAALLQTEGDFLCIFISYQQTRELNNSSLRCHFRTQEEGKRLGAYLTLFQNRVVVSTKHFGTRWKKKSKKQEAAKVDFRHLGQARTCTKFWIGRKMLSFEWTPFMLQFPSAKWIPTEKCQSFLFFLVWISLIMRRAHVQMENIDEYVYCRPIPKHTLSTPRLRYRLPKVNMPSSAEALYINDLLLPTFPPPQIVDTHLTSDYLPAPLRTRQYRLTFNLETAEMLVSPLRWKREQSVILENYFILDKLRCKWVDLCTCRYFVA